MDVVLPMLIALVGLVATARRAVPEAAPARQQQISARLPEGLNADA
jgi:hypothetical protein